MKLGASVQFSRELKRVAGRVDFDNLTDEQAEQFDREEQVTLERYQVVQLENPKSGILVGKRRISLRNYLTDTSNTIDEAHYPHTFKTDRAEVCLVATNMQRFHKVLREDLVMADE